MCHIVPMYIVVKQRFYSSCNKLLLASIAITIYPQFPQKTAIKKLLLNAVPLKKKACGCI